MKITSSILLNATAAAGFSMPANAQESYSAALTGAVEVPVPGDPDGAGVATLNWDTEGNRLCYALAIDDIDPATAVHIHRGAAGEAGPPVATLETPAADGGGEGCVDTTPGLRSEIRDNPAGAVRGQLEQ
jgi:hypothetical protein